MLGVCVGEQMLFDWSEEGRYATASACCPARSLRFRPRRPVAGRRLALQGPADGLEPRAPDAAASRCGTASPDDAFFYFVHSYYVVPDNPAHTSGETVYGAPFTSAVARDNIFATQFHPEKSAEAGLRLYRNFVHWNP